MTLIIYKCCRCERELCKLWRKAHILSSPQDNQSQKLLCFSCIPNNFRIRTIDPQGTFLGEDGIRTYMISNMLPAVPKDDGHSFWPFRDIPENLFRWWSLLRI
jgi:hypothetical protein